METQPTAVPKVWNADTYDSERRRLVPCFDFFYGSVTELVQRLPTKKPRLLDLGAGTGLLTREIVRKVRPESITLLCGSAEMLAIASRELAGYSPAIIHRRLTDALPAGPFDAVVSSLAIHHLSDDEKKDLFRRIKAVLAPGGVFVNAEQILGETESEQVLNESVHFDSARHLGSSESEIQTAIERMKVDRCAPLSAQLEWMRETGFKSVSTVFRWFRFAVYAGWND